MARRERRGPPLFGLLFVALGVVLLLQNLDVIDWDLWTEIWRFWPVLLVAVGANLILGRRLPWLTTMIIVVLLTGSILGAALLAESDASVRVDRIEEPLLSTRSLDLGMGFGAGSLVIDSLPRGSSNLVEGWFEAACGSASTSFQRYDGTAALDVDVSGESFFPCGWGRDWRVSLSPVPEVTMDLGTGASSIDLDLTDLRVTSLYVAAGATDLDIRMPARAGDVEVVIDAGAADIDLWIPSGVEAYIVNDSGISSFKVSRRFPSLESQGWTAEYGTIEGRAPGDIYSSRGYRDAENRIRVEINGGASSVSIR